MDIVAGVLVAVGVLGVSLRTVEFVRVTMPENYGSNPGFGAYESMCLPWWVLGAVGVGLAAGSWQAGALTLATGLLVLGVLSHVLGRLFGRSSGGEG